MMPSRRAAGRAPADWTADRPSPGQGRGNSQTPLRACPRSGAGRSRLRRRTPPRCRRRAGCWRHAVPDRVLQGCAHPRSAGIPVGPADRPRPGRPRQARTGAHRSQGSPAAACSSRERRAPRMAMGAVRLVPRLANVHVEAEARVVGIQLGMHAHPDGVVHRVSVGRIGPPEREGERVALQHLQRRDIDLPAPPELSRSSSCGKVGLKALTDWTRLPGPRARFALQGLEESVDLPDPGVPAPLECLLCRGAVRPRPRYRSGRSLFRGPSVAAARCRRARSASAHRTRRRPLMALRNDRLVLKRIGRAPRCKRLATDLLRQFDLAACAPSAKSTTNPCSCTRICPTPAQNNMQKWQNHKRSCGMADLSPRSVYRRGERALQGRASREPSSRAEPVRHRRARARQTARDKQTSTTAATGHRRRPPACACRRTSEMTRPAPNSCSCRPGPVP